MQGYNSLNRGINPTELWFTLASWIIGVGILTLPRSVAKVTETSDGWLGIVIGGTVAAFFSWISLKLALRFPGYTFREYCSQILTPWAGTVLTVLISMHFVLFPAFVSRSLADISRQYLFYRTPIEVVALVFLLLVVYAVCGSRIGILRLNVLFLPFVFAVMLFTLILNASSIDMSNLLPAFVTPWKQIAAGAQASAFSVIGSDILLFYPALLLSRSHTTRAVLIGTSIPMLLYVAIYLFSVSIFSREATEQILFPTIELAKRVELPGIAFERFELIFFTTWIMTIFNSAAMALDISVWSIQTVFPRWNKIMIATVLSPLVYLLAMYPQDIQEVETFGKWIGYSGFFFAVLIPSLLLLIALIRGVGGKRRAESNK